MVWLVEVGPALYRSRFGAEGLMSGGGAGCRGRLVPGGLPASKPEPSASETSPHVARQAGDEFRVIWRVADWG